MFKLIMAIGFAAFIWFLPGEAVASYQPETAPEAQDYGSGDVSEGILLVRDRSRDGSRPRRNFENRRFERLRPYNFGNPFNNGRAPVFRDGNRIYFYAQDAFNRFRLFSFNAGTPGFRGNFGLGGRPDFFARDRFERDLFFTQRDGNVGFRSPSNDPFGTRRRGW
ncbi:MAG: hypothetical protein C4576_15830 [Desulfobacteraceae bacterium]|nr:MAG: hypothetical protein C4576_15830 [Desulfobacteraceae bacterium]